MEVIQVFGTIPRIFGNVFGNRENSWKPWTNLGENGKFLRKSWEKMKKSSKILGKKGKQQKTWNVLAQNEKILKNVESSWNF